MGIVIGSNVEIEDTVKLEGNVVIGDNTKILGNSCITDSTIGSNCTISSTFIEKNNIIGDFNNIGPFAHLRENNEIGNYNNIGNYIEIKSSKIKDNNNMKHFGYVGNVIMGNYCNIGAGVVFANYHSMKEVKSSVVMGDKVSVGSNSTLVAPIKLGSNIMIGAGSVVDLDIIDNSLYINRGVECYKKNYYKENDL